MKKRAIKRVEIPDVPEKVWVMIELHFPKWARGDMRNLTCGECGDLRVGLCPGGGLEGAGVLECMESQAGVIFVQGQSSPDRLDWKRR